MSPDPESPKPFQHYVELQTAHERPDGSVYYETCRVTCEDYEFDATKLAQLMQQAMLGAGYHHTTVAEIFGE